MIPLTAIIFALLAFIVWRERMYDKQTAERDQAFRLERTGLLNRIQIPEAAPYIEEGEEPGIQYVPFEDDEAFEQAREALEDVGFQESE